MEGERKHEKDQENDKEGASQVSMRAKNKGRKEKVSARKECAMQMYNHTPFVAEQELRAFVRSARHTHHVAAALRGCMEQRQHRGLVRQHRGHVRAVRAEKGCTLKRRGEASLIEDEDSQEEELSKDTFTVSPLSLTGW